MALLSLVAVLVVNPVQAWLGMRNDGFAHYVLDAPRGNGLQCVTLPPV
jgi:hypothetical protein